MVNVKRWLKELAECVEVKVEKLRKQLGIDKEEEEEELNYSDIERKKPRKYINSNIMKKINKKK